MNPLNKCVNNLYKTIIGEIPAEDETVIKLHTRHLEDLGDLSFPILMKNWYTLIRQTAEGDSDTVFTHKLKDENVDSALHKIISIFDDFNVKIRSYKIIKTSVHIYLQKSFLFTCGITDALRETDSYGNWSLFSKHIRLDTNNVYEKTNLDNLDLTTLRLIILKHTIENLLKLTSNCNSSDILHVNLSSKMKSSDAQPYILCGPVINENGAKDLKHKALDLFDKRISDMRMMAQHRYQVQVKPTSEWHDLFQKLGRASVTIELLSNKPHKAVKITLNDLSGANKGPAFIFYNCARLYILLNEFDKKVADNKYPCLPPFEKIDFQVLNQPEEWELLYVYILQFPYVIKNCVRGIDKGIVNPQHLITFLSSLSSVFSVYYRRVRILTDAREHMLETIFARIYLLKAIQIVFHNALRILNIDPIKYM